MNYKDGKDIYVFIEQRNGIIQDVSYELISEARNLVDSRPKLNFEVVGVLLGYKVLNEAEKLIHYGADKVIVCDNIELQQFNTGKYTSVITSVVEKYHPEAFLYGGSVIGRDLAPRVSARVNTGLTADATKIEFSNDEPNSKQLWITRPAFGGNLYATIICPEHTPQMATIRPNVFEIGSIDVSKNGEIIEIEYSGTKEQKIEVLKRIEKQKVKEDISKAKIIVSGGRGLSGCFEVLDEVAKSVGGVVGASRAAVDQGIAHKEMQVGQTGKTVRPTIYLACGISGAIQHTAGMDKSELIIAINNDINAPIFDVADVGIVGDAKAILPLLTQTLNSNN
ncbi:electron transfer flavoprotein subunit alpha/FixB family protein [Mycoplasmatota bacterium WC44]